MERREARDLGQELSGLRARIDEWRRSPSRPLRMPEPLWGAAGRAARVHGLNQVAKALGLDYYNLKKRVDFCNAPDAAMKPAFIELGIGPTPAPARWRIEVEAPDGGKMTIEVPDLRQLDLTALARAFWRKP
jgi:hypothetical protein